MAISLKKMSANPELLAGGHRSCAACSAPAMLRQVLHVAGPNTVVGFATGCMEVSTTIYPYTAWKVPYIHCAFENSAATVSGAEAAFCALKRRGKIPADTKMNFIAFGGDGGTYDIGFQALSGAMERGHNMLYICYDNNAYMNTGIQRSSATPRGAATSTSPAGKVVHGKQQNRKDLTACMVAHDIPYVAQASVSNHLDFMKKVEKALSIEGPKFINILATCHRGWRVKPEDSIRVADLAVQTRYWPLYEVENGAYKINYKPKEIVPVVEWFKLQGRFSHLLKSDPENIVGWHQQQIEKNWAKLLKLEEISQAEDAA
ncbi:MAG: thiamine pyrophosphate-dependent enzyme [Planctomycetota bacterium]